MAIQKKQIKEFLLQALPNMKQVSGGTEIAGPCPFCGETRPKFYIGHFSDTDENPIRYNCFICKSSGMVDQAFLDKCNVQAAMDPEVLVPDEIVAGLDKEGKDRIFSVLENLKNEGKTIIFVSHSPDDVARYAERVLVLNKGKLKVEGDVREVFSSPSVPKPQAEVIASEMREKGINIPSPILTLEELSDEIVKVENK